MSGFQLQVQVSFSFQQNIGEAVKAFVDQVSEPPTKIMVLGPSYTSQAKVIAEVAPYYNLVEVCSKTRALISIRAARVEWRRGQCMIWCGVGGLVLSTMTRQQILVNTWIGG